MGEDPVSADEPESWEIKHIVVIGEMGAGKTEVGGMLANLTGRAHIDSDEMLEVSTGTTGADLARTEGVESLHRLELRLFQEAMAEQEPAVVSPAASVVDSETGRETLRDGVVVWLDVPVEMARGRAGTGDHRRPVGLKEARRLRRRRLAHYREVADLCIEPGGKTPKTIAYEIVEGLGGLRTQREA